MTKEGPAAFDSRGAIRLDRTVGHLRVGDSAPRVMVPAEALVALCTGAGEELTVAFGEAIGDALGRRIHERFEATGGVVAASFGLVVEHLAGEVALCGFGALSIERWGKALALVIDRAPVAAEAIGDVLLCGLLSAALRSATGAAASVVPVTREGSRTRFLVLGEGAVDGVLRELESGTPWGVILTDLNGGSA